MIRRFTSAQFVPADAGSKDKNPMGSALLSTPIIAPTNLDRHQILRNFCHESVRKGLNPLGISFGQGTFKSPQMRPSLGMMDLKVVAGRGAEAERLWAA
jgi:hypothetical protein